MDRKEAIQRAAEEARAASAETLTTHGTHSHLDDIPFIDLSYDEIAESAFVKGAEWADKHPKNPWISVKDRLPEPEEEILLYDKDSVKHHVVGWLRKKKGYNKAMWFVTNGYVADESITHWMPIVEPK